YNDDAIPDGLGIVSIDERSSYQHFDGGSLGARGRRPRQRRANNSEYDRQSSPRSIGLCLHCYSPSRLSGEPRPFLECGDSSPLLPSGPERRILPEAWLTGGTTPYIPRVQFRPRCNGPCETGFLQLKRSRSRRCGALTPDNYIYISAPRKEM